MQTLVRRWSVAAGWWEKSEKHKLKWRRLTISKMVQRLPVSSFQRKPHFSKHVWPFREGQRYRFNPKAHSRASRNRDMFYRLWFVWIPRAYVNNVHHLSFYAYYRHPLETGVRKAVGKSSTTRTSMDKSGKHIINQFRSTSCAN